MKTIDFHYSNRLGQQEAAIEALAARVQKLEAAAPGVGSIMPSVQMHFAKLVALPQNARREQSKRGTIP